MKLYTYYTNPSELFGFSDRLKIPQLAYEHALHNNTRNERLESAIAKDPKYAGPYAISVMQDRWPEAEPYIMKDPEWACRYAMNFIGQRWPEAEPYIMKDPFYAYYYARYIIKGRWPEAEPYIKENIWWDRYVEYFGIK